MAKSCAFCGRQDVQITREHVVNKSFLDRFYKIGKGYSNGMDRYTIDYLTIRDVCAKCNNEILSQLDESFLNFAEANLPRQIIKPDSSLSIKYNFGDLSRWLLKTLYNSERKNGYDQIPQKLHRYTQYILRRDDRTKLFRIYVELLHDVPEEEIRKHTKIEDDAIPKLDFLRVGNEVMTASTYVSIKYMCVTNLVFHVFLLDVGQHKESSFKSIFKSFQSLLKTKELYYLDPEKTGLTLNASSRTVIDIMANGFEGNKPIVQRMAEDKEKQDAKTRTR